VRKTVEMTTNETFKKFFPIRIVASKSFGLLSNFSAILDPFVLLFLSWSCSDLLIEKKATSAPANKADIISSNKIITTNSTSLPLNTMCAVLTRGSGEGSVGILSLLDVFKMVNHRFRQVHQVA